MHFKKLAVSIALTASLLFTNVYAASTVYAAPVESQETLAQYKLAVTSRISELEDNLNSEMHNQVGLLSDMRNISEYMMYLQHASRNRAALGFSDTEIDYYVARLIQYMDIFNERYNNDSDIFEKTCLSIGSTADAEDKRISEFWVYCEDNLANVIPAYYDKVLNNLEKEKPSSDAEKDIFLKSKSQLLKELYKCVIVYQNTPNSLNNITPLDDSETERKKYSVNGSGDNSAVENTITGIVTKHEELLQYGKIVAQKSSNESLDVNLDESIIEMFTNITVNDKGEYEYPDSIELSQPYLAMLSCSSVYTPFISYTGSSSYTNALKSLAKNDKQATDLVKAYNSAKDLRKPLYFREVTDDGSVTGPAELITVSEFIDDIQDGTAGSLVTVQGDFHYNSEIQTWIYSQGDLTYDYSTGTTIKENNSSEDTTEPTTTEAPTTENVNVSEELNIIDKVTVNAKDLNSPTMSSIFLKAAAVVDLTSTASMCSSLTNTIFVGDSRTVGLEQAFLGKTDANNLKSRNVYFVSKTGSAYTWFSAEAITDVNKILASNKNETFTIVVNMGINGLSEADKYVSLLNSLATGDWSSQRIIFQSVNPVDQSVAAQSGYTVTNSDIKDFNTVMRNDLEQKIGYVDTFSDLIDSNGTRLTSGYSTSDGIHYTNDTSLDICSLCLSRCVDNSAGSGTGNFAGTTAATTEDNTSTAAENSTTEEEKEKTELVSDDLESAVYAYDTVTDETYLTQPVLFYGTKYRRAIDNTTTAILQNIIKDTVNLDAIEDKDSRYLYINVFGDIVLDDNLVILPGFCNPLIYNFNTAYNPYSVAFMNSYPTLINRGLYFQVSSDNDIGKYIMLSQNTTEDISSSSMSWALITDNKDVASSNLYMSNKIEDEFYTNTYDQNIILSGQRCVFNSVATWETSDIANYNVVMQTYKPVINEKLLFPYSESEDTGYALAKVIAKNAYEYFCYNRDDGVFGNAASLNDNYLSFNFVISMSQGTKNPKGYSDDKTLEYKKFVSTKFEQFQDQVIKLSDNLIDKLATADGIIGMDSSYENFLLGNFLRIARENFILILVVSLLILLVAFLKFHRDLLEIIVLTLVSSLIIGLFVYILPIYIPMAYNFVIDKTSQVTAFRVVGMNTDEASSNNYAVVQTDEDGNYKYNSASLTLYKIDPTELDSFYANMRIEASDVMAGDTYILNQESGLFIEGDSIKVNTDILFDNLPIRGKYTTVNGTFCWQLKATKTVSNNIDYYVPFYSIVDNYIDKLNLMAQIYDLPRSTTTYANGATKDNYLVYSYVNSPIFLTPGDYGFVLQEDAEEYMSDYDTYLEQSIELESYLTTAFGSNTDWLGIAPIFTNLSEQDKATLWAQTMQDNGYYDKNWKPDEDKINDLIVYINNQTRDFVFDMDDCIGKLSDDTMVKLISLRATTAFTQRVSQFRHWLYPFSLDYAEITIGDILKASFTANYAKYVNMDMNIAEYIGREHGWLILIFFDILVLLLFLVTNIVKIMIPVLYLLLMVILLCRFISLGDVKIPIKGYLKTSASLFIAYTIFNLQFWFLAKTDGKVWGIFVALFVTGLVLYAIVNTILSIFMNVLDFGDREFSAKVTKFGDHFKFGDLFNNIRFNTYSKRNSNVLTNNRNSKRKSKYSFDASVESVYDDRRINGG